MTTAASYGLFRSAAVCSRCAYRLHSQARAFGGSSLQLAETSHLPRVAQPSLWTSLIPKAFRRSDDPEVAAERARRKALRSKEWNPATIFIVLGLIVGSNAINIISLKREMVNFSRKTDAKLELLREVVQRVKKGEDVDVEGLLGTGNPEQEQEWEDVLKELENAETLVDKKKRKEERRETRQREREKMQLERERRGQDIERSRDAERNRHQDTSDDVSTRRPKFIM